MCVFWVEYLYFLSLGGHVFQTIMRKNWQCNKYMKLIIKLLKNWYKVNLLALLNHFWPIPSMA